jgi:hypothetical protein
LHSALHPGHGETKPLRGVDLRDALELDELQRLLVGSSQTPDEGLQAGGEFLQARLINTLVSNSTFDRGSLSPTYVKPFDVFAKGSELEIGSPSWTIFELGSSMRLRSDPARAPSPNVT